MAAYIVYLNHNFKNHMNFIYYIDSLSAKLSKCFHYALFLLVKKPLYLLSYNSNGNKFVCHGLMRKCSLKINGGGNQVIVEQGVRLNNVRVSVSGYNNKLVIHKRVVFHEGGRVKLEDEGNVIEIGEGTDFMDCFFAVSDYDSKVIVGKNCLFSAKIVVRNSDVHSILNANGKRTNPARDTIIGDRVWVAYGATILKGSTIADDSIIGTQSVVAGIYVPQGGVAVGNPAHVVKEGVHWTRKRLRG